MSRATDADTRRPFGITEKRDQPEPGQPGGGQRELPPPRITERTATRRRRRRPRTESRSRTRSRPWPRATRHAAHHDRTVPSPPPRTIPRRADHFPAARRRRTALRLAGRADGNTLWLAHDRPLAFSLGGTHGVIVATGGLARHLGERGVGRARTRASAPDRPASPGALPRQRTAGGVGVHSPFPAGTCGATRTGRTRSGRRRDP
jgi:hypothetical protein